MTVAADGGGQVKAKKAMRAPRAGREVKSVPVSASASASASAPATAITPTLTPAPAPAPPPTQQSRSLAARDAMEALRLFAATTESLVPRQTPRPTKFDQYAWALSKAGKSDEEIATLLNCSELDARRGVTMLTTWINTVSDDIRNAYANEQIIKGIEGAGKVFQDAQRAERMIAPPVLDRESGLMLQEAQFVPDHTTRLEATRAVAEFAEKFAPKGKGTSINIGNTINTGNGNGAGLSFEARVRALREKHGLRNDADEIMDAEIIEDDLEDEGEDDGEGGDDGADGEDVGEYEDTTASAPATATATDADAETNIEAAPQ